MNNAEIVTVDEKNISEHPPTCFMNPKHVGYLIKQDWLKKRFAEGLKVKLLYLKEEKKPVAFIEYVPGEYAWRAVSANNYMFIHCIWVSKKTLKNKGYGTLLIKEVINDAEKAKMNGVAVITSEGPFMAGKDLFLKNGFGSIASDDPSFTLMIKKFKNGSEPKINDWESQLKKYKGLNIVYSNQCPWVVRSINELNEIAKNKGFKLIVIELNTASKAQNAPSLYATFNLIYNGKLLADHYISATRFKNILKKEVE